MKGTIKELLKAPGVQGYVIIRPKGIQIKLPAKYRVTDAKKRLRNFYDGLMDRDDLPGNILELYTDNMVIVSCISRNTMLMVFSSRTTNMAILRMTGKLVLANIIKEKDK
ncbi:MAG: hypothetical protein U9P80_05000 [Thermodesulfobacteriota bacterium]|nr:hypothetical protein [Thermodesulfobacteriota bacterium]